LDRLAEWLLQDEPRGHDCAISDRQLCHAARRSWLMKFEVFAQIASSE